MILAVRMSREPSSPLPSPVEFIHIDIMDQDAFYRTLGAIIAKRRKAAGLTQAGLADQLGLSRASIANIERGEQGIFVHQLIMLSHALQLEDISDLLPDVAGAIGTGVFVIDDSGMSDAQIEQVRRVVSGLTGLHPSQR